MLAVNPRDARGYASALERLLASTAELSSTMECAVGVAHGMDGGDDLLLMEDDDRVKADFESNERDQLIALIEEVSRRGLEQHDELVAAREEIALLKADNGALIRELAGLHHAVVPR